MGRDRKEVKEEDGVKREGMRMEERKGEIEWDTEEGVYRMGYKGMGEGPV